ncbi:MAG: type II toxin-antitoxin system VapB family antitoxin [Novosphingobium sp.]
MNRVAQLNVRSPYARERAASLARATGMTTTQVVEEALRAYTPPLAAPPGKLVRRGPLLVLPGTGKGKGKVSLAAANAALEASRDER